MALKEQVLRSVAVAVLAVLRAGLGDSLPVPSAVVISLVVVQAFALLGALLHQTEKGNKTKQLDAPKGEAAEAAAFASCGAVVVEGLGSVRTIFASNAVARNAILMVTSLLLARGFRTYGVLTSPVQVFLANAFLGSCAFLLCKHMGWSGTTAVAYNKPSDPYSTEFWPSMDMVSQDDDEETEGKKALAGIEAWSPLTALPEIALDDDQDGEQ